MSDISADDQRLLRRAEVQHVVDAASEKIITAMSTSIDDLRRTMEARFSKAHDDLKTHNLAIHGIELAIARIQGTVGGIERDLHQTRVDTERELAKLRETQNRQNDRIMELDRVQTSRTEIYNMMQRVLLYIVMAFFAAIGGLVYMKGN